jgi:hypothetical protein
MKNHSPIRPATPVPSIKTLTLDIKTMNKQDENFSLTEIDKILSVKKVLYNALFDFNLTITKLGRNMVQGYFVSGGCIASLLQGEDPKDFDIWFTSQFVADPIIKLFTQDPSYKNEVADVDDKYREVLGKDGKMITENAVTLKSGLQLITKQYGTTEEIRKTFDYIHCLPVYVPSTDKLYISPEQYFCCVNKILKVNCAESVTPYRQDKFAKRGYTYGEQTTVVV